MRRNSAADQSPLADRDVKRDGRGVARRSMQHVEVRSAKAGGYHGAWM